MLTFDLGEINHSTIPETDKCWFIKSLLLLYFIDYKNINYDV